MPKPIFVQSKESIELKNKFAIKDLFTGTKEKTIGKISKKFSISTKIKDFWDTKNRKDFLVKNMIQNPFKKIISKSIKKESSLPYKKEIISKLKGKFELDKITSKALVKQYSKDIVSLKKHGFEVMEHKKPEPKYIVPRSGTHTKHSIIKHFKEVYEHGR